MGGGEQHSDLLSFVTADRMRRWPNWNLDMFTPEYGSTYLKDLSWVVLSQQALKPEL